MSNANTPDHDPTSEDTLDIHPRVLTGALITGLAIAVIVGAASFKLSFSTLLDLAVMAGIHRGDAWVIPVALDGPILACAVIRIALSQHTDPATVRGRRLVVAVLAIMALLSIAGNAYHAVLTATVLNAAVAAAIAALAPAMVLTMSEIVAVVLRAPRRRRAPAITPSEIPRSLDSTTDTAHIDDHIDRVDAEQNSATTGSALAGIDEDLDNGLLKPAVWTSVDLYLKNPDWSFSDIARHLELHTSTVSRHIKTWTQVQQNIASERSTAAPGIVDQAHTIADADHDHSGEDVTEARSEYGDADYDSISTDRDYAGAAR
ncbi:DUF2637 domain-containing protein [Rhodococcoides kyotonense]|uniref:DUF2637 domain-containing protein n=1 Tax=Rhodococcoides kyotonense TaxID=398843 RepID=A0A177YEX4_9NOCA|nr:DUF2637 domain-containing protein [Rhodococcus kyotonensis]OAK54015.1 hypothetical protein A3K89_21140 [Rhodococcus kyotonensis]